MATGIIIVLLTAITAYLYSRRRNRLPLPPAPPAKFFTGNIHQIPQQKAWQQYAAWAEIYGPVVSFRVHNRQYIVLNSLKSAAEVLQLRAAKYSDRPTIWMNTELANRKLSPFNIPCTHPYFKAYRTIFKSSLNPRNIQTYHSLQSAQSHLLLDALHKNPEQFAAHVHRNVANVILDLAYGWKVQNDDSLVHIMHESLAMTAALTQPGRWLVEVIPSLRFVPSWFPGAGFKRMALDFRQKMSRLDMVPFEWVKQQIQSGSYTPSVTSEHLSPEDGSTVSAEQEDIIKWCSSSIYVAGVDTTTASILFFILAMTLNPEVQKRAQAEIDVVVGTDRFPTFEDKDKLPYIGALLLEVLRWVPVAPVGLTHCAMKDDVYNGYRIPKGTFMISNIFAMAHDKDMYSEPLEFRPERFLGPSPEPDPRKFVFGFGLRACPGMHFGQESLYIHVCSILAAFTISKALDEKGEEITPCVDTENVNVVSFPRPFKCRFIPRNEDLLATLAQ